MMEFGQPLALWTGLALGLPVLAHLAYQTVSQRFAFPTLRFLSFSTIPRSGRRKPSDWALLLLRLLFFCALTLLLADPHWTEPDDPRQESFSISECLIVLDCSPSMGGWGGWEEGVRYARSLLRSDDQSRIGLLAIRDGTLAEWSVGTERSDLALALEELETQSSPWGIQAMIDRGADLFSPHASEKRMILISDFQKSSWQEVTGSFAERGIEVELVPVGHGDDPWADRSGNQAVVDCKASSLGSGKVRVWAALRNWDDRVAERVVSVFAGGESRQSERITLPPLGTEQVQFVLSSDDFAQAVVRLEGNDSLATDDNQSLWILPPAPKSFGFWRQPADNPVDLMERQFLGAAIKSAGDGVWMRWRENEDGADALRAGGGMPSLDFLMIVGLSGWFEDEGLSDPLLSYLNAGGTALITPPEDSYVRMNRALREPKILDFSFSGKKRTAFPMDPFRIDVLPENSSLAKVFSGDSSRDLYLAQILQFLEVEEGAGARVPLRDRSLRPLVLERSFANGGKLVFLAFRMLPEWTDLPLRNAFLPLLVELCSLDQSSLESGGALRMESGEKTELGQVVFHAKGKGLHQVENQRIEVVHPLIESMPELMKPKELREAVSGRRLLQPDKIPEDDPALAKASLPLWPWFALSAVLLLLVETFLSTPRSSLISHKEAPRA